MNNHILSLSRYGAGWQGPSPAGFGTAGSYGNEQITVQPGLGWDGLTVRLTFHPAGGTAVSVVVPASGVVAVPHEATATQGLGLLVAEGYRNGVQLYAMDLPYTVLAHSDGNGANTQAPTASIYQQLVTLEQQSVTAAAAARTAAQTVADSLASYRTAAAQNVIDATKQDTIADLATIRAGAAAGATAVQPEAGKGLFSGNYNDLTNKPTALVEQVNADWNAESGKAQILNKPVIPAEVTESTVSGWGFIKSNGTDTISALANLGVSASAAELNVLDGITADTAELNCLAGVEDNVQDQIDTVSAAAGAAQTTANAAMPRSGGTFSGSVTMASGTDITLAGGTALETVKETANAAQTAANAASAAADAAQTTANAAMPQSGGTFSGSVTMASGTDITLASGTALETVKETANAAQTAANAASTAAGAAQTTANAAQTAANAAMPKSGGTFTGQIKAVEGVDTSAGVIRDIAIFNSSWTAQSTRKILMKRK